MEPEVRPAGRVVPDQLDAGEGIPGIARVVRGALGGRRAIAIPPFRLELEARVDDAVPERLACELAAELSRASSVHVVAGPELLQALKTAPLVVGDLHDPDTIPALGRWVAADCVALGAVYRENYYGVAQPGIGKKAHERWIETNKTAACAVSLEYVVTVYDVASATMLVAARACSAELFGILD